LSRCERLNHKGQRVLGKVKTKRERKKPAEKCRGQRGEGSGPGSVKPPRTKLKKMGPATRRGGGQVGEKGGKGETFDWSSGDPEDKGDRT